MASKNPRQPAKRPRTADEVEQISPKVTYTTKDRLRAWLSTAKNDIGYFRAIKDLAESSGKPGLFLAQISQSIVLEQEQLRLRPLFPKDFSYDWDPKAKNVIPGSVKYHGQALSSKLEWFVCVYQYAMKNGAHATVKVGDNAIFIIYDHCVIQDNGKEYFASYSTRFELNNKDPLVIIIAATLANYKGGIPPTLLPRLAECTLKLLPLIRDKSLDCVTLVKTLITDKTFKSMQQLRELHTDPRLANFCAALSSWVFSSATIEELTSKDNLTYSTPQHLKAMCIEQNRFRMPYRFTSQFQYADMDSGTELKVVPVKDLKDTDQIVCIKSYIGNKFFKTLTDTKEVLVSESPITRVGKKKKASDRYEMFGAYYMPGGDVRRVMTALKKLSVADKKDSTAAPAEAAGAEAAKESTEAEPVIEELGGDLDDLF